MESTSTDPRRGEIWLASLGAGRRGEPGKNRPVVVISADWTFEVRGEELIVIVPLSASIAPAALRPPLGPEVGIVHPSAAICPAIRGVSPTRLLHRLGKVGPEKMWEIERALELVLALD
jgi:mRNA interferase MazF